MSSTIKNVLLIGAGGNLGPSILEALDNDPQFTVTVLSRKSSKSSFPSHIKVHAIDDSYPEKDLLDIFTGQDAVVSMVGHGSTAKQIDFVNAAVATGVKRFIPSDFSTDSRNPVAIALLPHFKDKNDIVDYLKTQETKGLTWSGVITGGFFDWGLKIGILGYNLSTTTALIYDSGDAKFSMTNLATIGAAIAAILHKPEQTANKYIPISSFSTSQNEILAALEKSTGKKWTIERTTAAQSILTGQEKLSRGDFSGALDIIKGIVTGGPVTGADLGASKELANELLGLPQETVAESVEKVVKG